MGDEVDAMISNDKPAVSTPRPELTEEEGKKLLTEAWARISKQCRPEGVMPIKGDPERKGWKVVRIFVR